MWSTSVRHIGPAPSRVCALAHSHWLPPAPTLERVTSIPGFQDPRRLCGRPLSDTSGQPSHESAHSPTRTGCLLSLLSSRSLSFRGFRTPGVCVAAAAAVALDQLCCGDHCLISSFRSLHCWYCPSQCLLTLFSRCRLGAAAAAGRCCCWPLPTAAAARSWSPLLLAITARVHVVRCQPVGCPRRNRRRLCCRWFDR